MVCQFNIKLANIPAQKILPCQTSQFFLFKIISFFCLTFTSALFFITIIIILLTFGLAHFYFPKALRCETRLFTRDHSFQIQAFLTTNISFRIAFATSLKF